MSIGEIIKKERQKNNISQAKLGEILNVTQQAVAKWEKDFSEPDTRALKQMAKLFGVTVDYLIEQEDFTAEELAAGASPTRKENITPLEDELLYHFRRLGKKHGEETQRAIISMIEKMH